MTVPTPPAPGHPGRPGLPVAPPPRTPATLSYLALAFGIASPVLTILTFVLNDVLVLAYDSPVRSIIGALPWLAGLAAIVLGIVALVRRAQARAAAIIGMIVPLVGHVLLFFAWVLIFVGVMTAVGVSQS